MKRLQKHHKLYLKKKRSINFNSKLLNQGEFGIQILENGYITEKQLESVRKVIVRKTERSVKIWLNVFFNFPKTAKAKESRMGKGKGKINSYVARVALGSILLEVSFNNLINIDILKSAITKLPVKARIVINKKL